MIELSEIQKEAITELMNISIGRAASSLNQLVDEEIRLTVPRVLFIERSEASKRIDERGVNGTCAVMQEFSGPCSGDALLVFPEKKSLELVRAIIGETVPLDSLTELEHEALTEVGNIVLNASLGSIANLLDMEITCSLPEYLKGSGEEILSQGSGNMNNGDMAMFMEVDFELKQRKINGYVIFMLDMDSANEFIKVVNDYASNIVS